MDLLYDETTAAVCTHTLVDGTQVYPLDSRITKLERVSYKGIDLPKMRESEYSGTTWRTDSDEPTSYYVRQRSIYLHPTPDADADTESMSLAVYRMPLAKIEDEDADIEIPVEFHMPLVYWALYRVYNLRDEDLQDPTKAGFYLSKFVDVFGEEVPADVRIHQFESPQMQTLRPKAGYQYTNSELSDPDFDNTGWDG